MSLITYDELCESQDYDHCAVFVTVDSYENVVEQLRVAREHLNEACDLLFFDDEYGEKELNRLERLQNNVYKTNSRKHTIEKKEN